MDVKTTCLGVLALGPASGYEIRKAFEEGPFAHFAEGGFGSIYPALTKLTQEGLVDGRKEEQDKRPDKKIFHITEAGRQRLIDSLAATQPAEDKFKSNLLFNLFFTDFLPRAHVEKAVDARIEWYRQKLEHMRGCMETGAAHLSEPVAGALSSDASQGPHIVRNFGIAVYQAALDYLERERDAIINAAGSKPATKITTAQDAAE